MTAIWTRGIVLPLARVRCCQCLGYGLVKGEDGNDRGPCKCVLRNLFRTCYLKYRYVQANEEIHTTHCDHMFGSGGRDKRPSRARLHSRPNQEFAADFVIVSRRTLGRTSLEGQIFQLHFIDLLPWRPCCERLKVDRGTFFHAVYRIEQRLGRAFRELHPYCLYPIDEYFSASVWRKNGTRLVDPPEAVPTDGRRRRLRPILQMPDRDRAAKALAAAA